MHLHIHVKTALKEEAVCFVYSITNIWVGGRKWGQGDMFLSFHAPHIVTF